MAGRNFAGQEVSHKDAHTMVVLRGSRELLDDDEEESEGGGSDRRAGDVIAGGSQLALRRRCAPTSMESSSI